MISVASWRRDACRPVDVAVGHGSYELLSASDAGSVSVLHLSAGSATAPASAAIGQLVLIVAGEGEVVVDGESARVSMGDVVRWPAGCRHQVRTERGVSVIVSTYPDDRSAWRVSRPLATGSRWVVGVFAETDRARAFREKLRAEDPERAVTLD